MDDVFVSKKSDGSRPIGVNRWRRLPSQKEDSDIVATGLRGREEFHEISQSLLLSSNIICQ